MEHAAAIAPSVVWTAPFAMLLLAIALFPLIPHLSHWWHYNSSKLIVAVALSILTCGYYLFRGRGFHESDSGISALGVVLHHAVIGDYFPFMVLLFSLYTISGGIRVNGSFSPRTSTNAMLLFIGAMLASVIGTTGASMLLIRPLLEINRHRKHVKHTVIFFIFLVSNVGGSLLPVGDPPLFLGYLKGVPFLWTLHLIPEWMTCIAILLAIYAMMDS
ncbi:sodium:proton antiporter, partial [Candidatus Sumerlaeota bacterium]|nr:sodium:proton antiporter [Candidatus Sumerlaeota bacterium]